MPAYDQEGRVDRFCFGVEIPVTWTDDHASKVSPVTDSLSTLLDLWRIRCNRSRGLYD